MKKLSLASVSLVLFAAFFMSGVLAFAQAAIVPEVSLLAFLQATIKDALSLKTIGSGGPLVLAALAVVLRFLISGVKVSALRPYIWDKLNDKLKALYGPVLGLLLALVTLPAADYKLQTLVVAIMTGSLSVPVHAVLQTLQELPGVSTATKAVVSLLQKLLGGAK